MHEQDPSPPRGGRCGPGRTARGGRPLLGALAALSLLACRRTAPGPGECTRFAEVWHHTERDQALGDDQLRPRFQQVVERCLTSPFDRLYVDCLVGGEDRRACLAGYRRRAELARGAPELP